MQVCSIFSANSAFSAGVRWLSTTTMPWALMLSIILSVFWLTVCVPFCSLVLPWLAANLVKSAFSVSENSDML